MKKKQMNLIHQFVFIPKWKLKLQNKKTTPNNTEKREQQNQVILLFPSKLCQWSCSRKYTYASVLSNLTDAEDKDHNLPWFILYFLKQW